MPRRWIWASLDGASYVPLDFSLGIQELIPCESNWQATQYESIDAPPVLGDAGCSHGLMQVNLCQHAKAMLDMQLEPSNESDRVTFAANVLYQRWPALSPFYDWSCSH